jgi:RNA polymerase sigma-70 factor (ECF subfamily)
MHAFAHVDIDQLYRRYYALLRDKCRRMLASDADAQDVAQDTLVRLWACRDTIRDAAAVPAWLYQTSTRLAIDRHRAGLRMDRLAEAPAIPARQQGLDRQLESRRALRDLVKRTPPEELAVVLLSRVDGLCHDEICAITGRSERTTRRLLARFDRRVAAWRRSTVA